MNRQGLSHQVDAFISWKKGIIRELTRYRTWLKDNDLCTEDIDERLNSAQGNLQSDNITLAFVGEFSRGKTELINALFFAQYGRRLLPSKPGRTTMCPTELFFDLKSRESYIMLLPVETRQSTESVKQLKEQPHAWQRIDLDFSDADQMSRAFHRVAETKSVSRSEAIALGFDVANLEPSGDNVEKVNVPAWRHALISFKHPLLRQGLVIIDTPGLNALGCEPELTFSMLPDAQAVLFMLGADTGVTQTDAAIWRDHIRQTCGHMSSNLYAVLNKVDLLWNDPDGPEAEAEYLDQVVRSTAQQLSIPPTGILPLSAKAGLNGKIEGDSQLLEKSQLPVLEKLLSENIVQGKELTIQGSIVNDVVGLLTNSRMILKGRLDELKEERRSLQSDLVEKHTVFSDLNEKTRLKQERYHDQLVILKKHRDVMQQQALALVHTVRPENFEDYLETAKQGLARFSSGRGTKKTIDGFFASVQADFLSMRQEYLETQTLISEAYEDYRQANPKETFTPPTMDVDKPLAKLLELKLKTGNYQKTIFSLFRNNKVQTERFVNTVAEEVRGVYKLAHNDVRAWCKISFTPILRHAQEQKKLLDDQLVMVRSMASEGSSVKESAIKLQQMTANLEKQLIQADSILRALRKPPPSHKKQQLEEAALEKARVDGMPIT